MKVDRWISVDAEATIRRLSIARVDARDPESLLLSTVAIVEAFVDNVIQGLIDDAAAQQSRLGAFLLAKAEGTFRQSWQARNDILRGGFEVVVEPQVLAQDLQLVIDIRNALAHGDGSLTDQQVASWSKAVALRRNLERRLGVSISGRRIRLTSDSAGKAVTVLIEYISALEAAVREARAPGMISALGAHEETDEERR